VGQFDVGAALVAAQLLRFAEYCTGPKGRAIVAQASGLGLEADQIIRSAARPRHIWSALSGLGSSPARVL